MNESARSSPADTREESYTSRLLAGERTWWKRILDVQAPYRWNLRRLKPGFVLDLGCGIGRNLAHLGGNGVGIDHNPASVAVARSRGLRAFTPEEFEASKYCSPGRFDSLLVAHVAEHMNGTEFEMLLRRYVVYLQPAGRVIVIAPQEAGFRSDPTHVEFVDFAVLHKVACAMGLAPEREFSFPFPRFAGRFFRYNEFVSVIRVSG